MKAAVLTLIGGVILCFSAQNSWASLISIGAISDSGQGHGAVLTSVTFQNTGTESGCVGSNTAGTLAFGGGSVYLGSAECPSGITGGDETKGNGPSGLYTATNLGIQSGNSSGLTFGSVVLLFNGVQNQANPSITLNNLALDLFSTNGALLGSFTLPSPVVFDAFPGTGNAGLGFELDAIQTMQANTILAANPTLLIATAATASGANGGPETISLTTSSAFVSGTQQQSVVPEPRTMAITGAALLLLVRRRVQSTGGH